MRRLHNSSEVPLPEKGVGEAVLDTSVPGDYSGSPHR